MADIVQNVRDLSVHITEDSQRVVEVVVTFTAGPRDTPDNWTINIPAVIQIRALELIAEFQKTLSQADDIVRDTVVRKDYTIELQP
jgi:hypothetical protein